MPDRLRIALVTHYPQDPMHISGGIQAVSARLVAELRRAPGVELHVLHCHSDVSRSRTVSDGPVTVHFLAQTRRRLVPNMMTKIGRLARLLRELAPDVVHAHGHNLAIAGLEAGYQPVWTIHGIVREEAALYPGLFHRLNFALARRYERVALARVECVTAVSRYVAEAYGRWSSSRWASDPARWHIIENPAPPDYFTLPRQPIPGRVLMPASVIPLKDPLTLIRAAALVFPHVRQLEIDIAGSLADAGYVRQVRDEIERLGLQRVVHLLGPLDLPALQQEFARAAVVVLPSRQEITPMAVIEGMAAGAVVIASAVGGVPYMMTDRETGRLVPPGQPASLAEALTELLEDAGLAQRMGAAARAVAHARFRPDRIAASYLALLQAAAERRLLKE